MQPTTRRIIRITLLATASLFACDTSSSEQGYVSASVRGDMQHADVTHVRHDAELDEACGSGGLTAAGERDLRRWPYLQKVGPTTAEILFTSAAERPFHVVARTPEGELLADVAAKADRGVKPSTGTQYVAAIDDLPAGSTVCYELVAEGEAFTAPAGFLTAPDPKGKSSLRMVALGDLGTQTPDQYAVLEQMQNVPSDLIVFTGDIAYKDGTPAQIDRNFFEVYREMLGKVPAFPASGNHEYNTNDAQPFRDAFSLFENGAPEGVERWYSFDWGPVHFVVLDTEVITDAQIEWLDADLGAHDRPWTIAVAHRPPYSAGSHGSDEAVRAAFSPVFAEHEVPLVLLGHEHHYERTKPIDGVVYLITGGGGRGTRAVGEEDFTAVADRVAHFVWLEADDEKMRLVAIDATGEAFDSVVFQRE